MPSEWPSFCCCKKEKEAGTVVTFTGEKISIVPRNVYSMVGN